MRYFSLMQVKKLQSLSEDGASDSSGSSGNNNGRTKVLLSKPFEVKRQISQDKV